MRRSVFSVIVFLFIFIFSGAVAGRAQALVQPGAVAADQGVTALSRLVGQPLPDAPDPGSSWSVSLFPAEPAGGFLADPAAEPKEKLNAPYGATMHYGRFSRIGVGADLSPLGIGIKGAIILSEKIDLRVMGNFFSFTSPKFDVEDTKATGTLQLASIGTAVDWYPRNSIWRLSAGLLLWNNNHVTASGTEAPGTSFTLDGLTYWSAGQNGSSSSCSGAVPVTSASSGTLCPVGASGLLGLHTNQPEFTVSGGFGRFIPRSPRHWSMPAEYGVVFMGHPTVSLTAFGDVCTSPAQTECSNVADTSTPLGAQFNNSLQATLARWRRSLDKVSIYPIFSYGVMYSFNLPGRERADRVGHFGKWTMKD